MKKNEDQRKRKAASSKSDPKNENSKGSHKNEEEAVSPKYGPMPSFPHQRVWARIVVIFGVLIFVYYSTNKEKEITFVKQNEAVQQRIQDVPCSQDYLEEVEIYPDCVPEKCGRIVSDYLVTATEADMLLRLAQKCFALGGSDGGASILDLHSGAMSVGKNFVNIYSVSDFKNILQMSDFTIYRVVKTKIEHAVAHHFGVPAKSLHLTHPTFFSRLTDKPAQTTHDEYWHVHVDKETYEAFHYTSLLYLSDYGVDFQGGRFIFVDPDGKNRTVEPRKGRVSMFTSGWENPHYVEPVSSGTRYAITVSFTCNRHFAIDDPSPSSFNKYGSQESS